MAITFQNIMDFATVNRENYEQLKQQIQCKMVIPFVGAGLSACVYPGWREVLEIIAEDVMDPTIKNTVLSLLSDEYVREHDDALEQAAKYLEDAWTKSVFDNKLYRIFSPEKLEKSEVKEILYKQAVIVLPKLFPQGVVLTTNYDHVLEKVYRIYGRGLQACDVLHVERLNRELREMSSEALLIKLHGDVDEVATSVILNRESYDRAYQDGSPLIVTLNKCYGMKSMLFLGCSLEHDRTMDELQKTLEPGNIHFAIYSCKGDGKTLQNIVKNMGKKNILPILYPDKQYVCVRLILEQLLMELNLNQYRQLPVKLREYGNELVNLAECLVPEMRASTFCGRDKELGKLLDFCLKRNDSFLWWAVTGEGGVGKSRIAVELSICMRKGGWNVFFLKKYSDYTSLDSSSKQNGKNTLYILDRVIGYEEQIGKWMEERYRESKGTIVRILLVERQNTNLFQNGWIEQVQYGVEMPGILEECCYNHQMLELYPMDKKDIKNLIVSYGNISEADFSSADEILKQLEKIDPSKMRPLYAILLVEVWKREKLNKMDTRNKLLEYIWKAESARYQTYFLNLCRSMPIEAKARTKVYLELKLAATLLNGLEWSQIQKHFVKEWECIADKECIRKMIISNLEESQERGIVTLQPDVLANYYILREATENMSAFEHIFIKCWDINSIECFTRIINVISDFPEKLNFLKQVINMSLNLNKTQQINVYGLLMVDYALLSKNLSDMQETTWKLMDLMAKEKKNVGLKYSYAICVTELCCGIDSFEEKWKYFKILLNLNNIQNGKEKNRSDMMMFSNMMGRCLVSCYEIYLTESEFQKVERERKKLLLEIRQLHPLYFYMLGALFGRTLLTFFLTQNSINIDLLVSLLKELLAKIHVDESVRLIYIHNYMTGLLLQLEKQTNNKKLKRIWYQIDGLFHKEAVRLMERVGNTQYFLPVVYTEWKFSEKSLELIVRNIYENNENMVENIVGKESQINAAMAIYYFYDLSMVCFMFRANDESALELLERLKYRYINAKENRKDYEAIFYSRGLAVIYNKYASQFYCDKLQISAEHIKLFQTWENEVKTIKDTFCSDQIHKNWIEVLTTSTIVEQDIKVLRNKVKIIKAEYEASKKKKSDDIKTLRYQYSMALSNLCKESKKQLECKEIISQQWILYDESDLDPQEKEKILWEIAKTINNTVKNANSLEEYQMYSKEIQKISLFDCIHSEEIKESILLEYGKSLVNSFPQIPSDMKDLRKAYLRDLEFLYLDSQKRNSDLQDKFRIRWILGLNNAAASCANEDEKREYLTKKDELMH